MEPSPTLQVRAPTGAHPLSHTLGISDRTSTARAHSTLVTMTCRSETRKIQETQPRIKNNVTKSRSTISTGIISKSGTTECLSEEHNSHWTFYYYRHFWFLSNRRLFLEYQHQRAGGRVGNPHQRSLYWSREGWKTQGELGVTKSVEGDTFPFGAPTLLVGRRKGYPACQSNQITFITFWQP